VAIEYRWADGRLDRMRAMAADLIARNVTVILAGGSNTGVREVIAATQTIPIVFKALLILSQPDLSLVWPVPAAMLPG
jgi:putative tryptophan/tyrosine transport system substrate-binding protein